MKAGLLGRKLGHSLSPQIHRLFGDYDYRLFAREPSEIVSFVRTSDLDFFNVTIPYKRDAYQLCDELTPIARQMGNVNFVMRRADGTLVGDNTDAFGVERLLEYLKADVRGKVCSILGSGGAAMTVKTVLEAQGAREAQFVRRGETPSGDAYLIVNATPVGMYPDSKSVRIDISDFPRCEVVADLVYNPSPTRLVREAWACGKKAADGLVMLIGQAYRAFELAGGVQPPIIYLYGPPACGKSTLGTKLAAATGRRLVDLDAAIVRRAGKTIPEIFAQDGETAFRMLEKAELKAASEGNGLIVALGGGALLDTESRAVAERTGRVVCLNCPEYILARRLSRGSRPLARDSQKLHNLLSSRVAHYASFAVQIDLTMS